MEYETPAYYFSLFLDDKLFQILSEFTNKHRDNNIKKNTASKAIIKWTETDKEEIKKFFGVLSPYRACKSASN